MRMQKQICFNIIVLHSLCLVFCARSVTLLSFPEQTVAMSGAGDLVWEIVSLGRLNASQTKILVGGS